LNLVAGAGLGASVMYFLDPISGKRRRGLVRNQLIRLQHKAGDRAAARLRDFRNRAFGTVAKFRGALCDSQATLPDDVLIDRVRSQMGRHTTHASALEVSAHDGVVSLRGPILAEEVDCLIDAVRQISGVEDVEEALDVYKSPAGVSAFQVRGPRQ
jgi:hypothetical protein